MLSEKEAKDQKANSIREENVKEVKEVYNIGIRMEGKNNVWIIKLNPSGGLLTEKEHKKWIKMPGLEQKLKKEFNSNEIKKYREKYKKAEIANLCKKEKIVAIGWILNPKDTWVKYSPKKQINRKIYIKLYKKTPWPEENKNELNSSVKNFQELKGGDFCWVRDTSDKYYVCKIKGDWYYDNSKEAWAMDIAQRYNCKWVEVGDATETPAEVVKKLITRGPTVSKMDDKVLLDMSKYLFEGGGEKAVQKAVNEFDKNKIEYIKKDILSNLTQYDYEDFVGFYLQSKGYFIMPSTRYQSTKDYEFVAIRKEGMEKIAVQVKYHDKPNEKLDAKEKKYGNLSKTYKIYLACNNGVKDIDKIENKRIVEINNDKLAEFIRNTPCLFLPRLKFLVMYKKHQEQIK